LKSIRLEEEWLEDMIPKGLPYPSSTLISGPGGTGKPLIGFAFIYDWLKNGGKVIFIALQYPESRFVRDALEKLYGIDMDDYKERVVYVQADFHIDDMETIDANNIKANLARPEIWDRVIEESEELMNGEDFQKGPGTMVFAAALNLLLFSPTYKEEQLIKLEELLRANDQRSYLFTVSTTLFKDEIEKLEEAADNLLFAEMGNDMEMSLRIERFSNQDVIVKEKDVPFAKELLVEIKEIAEHSRKKVIPSLKRI